MKQLTKLSVLALSLAVLSVPAHAKTQKNSKTKTTQTNKQTKKTTETKPAVAKIATAPTTATPTVSPNSKPASPKMRGEITTTITNPNAADLLTTKVAGLPSVSVDIADVQYVPTVHTAANKSGSILLDTTLMDEFITVVSPNARHYPPSFPNPTAEYLATQNVKHLSDWIEPYANAKDASFDIILRAAKLNAIARNLNVGNDYSLRATNHLKQAIKLNSNHAEANFLLGAMLSESGGFKEGQKYLDKAASLGYAEAEQSLAQADLLNDKKADALSRLQRLQQRYPNDPQIAEQIRIIETGGYYIWRNNNPISLKAVH